MEDKIISAVRTFASSINSGSKVVADMSELIEVTSQLPLSSFDYWERIIRSEFSLAIWESIPPKWKVWSKPKELVTWLDLISWDGYKREKAPHRTWRATRRKVARKNSDLAATNEADGRQ